MAKKKDDVQVEETLKLVECEAKAEPVPEIVSETEEKVKDVKGDESPRFTLSQLVASNRYKKWAHLLGAYLKEGKTYTLKEVDELISGLI